MNFVKILNLNAYKKKCNFSTFFYQEIIYFLGSRNLILSKFQKLFNYSYIFLLTFIKKILETGNFNNQQYFKIF